MYIYIYIYILVITNIKIYIKATELPLSDVERRGLPFVVLFVVSR